MTYNLHRVNSDVFSLENIVQTVGIQAGKNILIDTLRDVFRDDREYQYVDDVFGFPKTPSNLGLDPAAGIDLRSKTLGRSTCLYRLTKTYTTPYTERNCCWTGMATIP
jgi:hypothetical protein